jgi:hypothetical protein
MCRSVYAFMIGALLIVSGCNDIQKAIDEAKKEPAAPPRDNYIVLLDLSDRILLNNQQQVAKDLTIIKTIYAVFKSRLQEKDPTRLYYNVQDKLKLLIAPQKTTPESVYDMAGNLRVELSSEEPEKKLSAVDNTEKILDAALPEIYKQAVISNNSNDFAGADIWKYFNEDLEDDLEKDGQNTLFIITDGYLDFENTIGRESQKNRYTSCLQIISALKNFPDWRTKFDEGDYGLLTAGKKFPNLKVVLLEVNPRQEWSGEYHLLTRIWSKWFSEMDISTYRFIKDDNINEVRESLEKFMQVKIAFKPEPAKWMMVTEKSAPEVVIADATSKENASTTFRNNGPADSLENNTFFDDRGTDMTFSKKKENPITNSNRDTSRITIKPAKKARPSARKAKNQNEVSFGPIH